MGTTGLLRVVDIAQMTLSPINIALFWTLAFWHFEIGVDFWKRYEDLSEDMDRRPRVWDALARKDAKIVANSNEQ